MLIYNFKRILKARGIERPYTYLKKAGFSSSFASKVNGNKVKRLNLPEIERLCILLKCTPNDFYEWHPNNNLSVDDNHPLNKIKTSNIEVSLSKMINNIPLDKLKDIEKLIADSIKE
jgi:DNA-binding Xre family transcriptional regulator